MNREIRCGGLGTKIESDVLSTKKVRGIAWQGETPRVLPNRQSKESDLKTLLHRSRRSTANIASFEPIGDATARVVTQLKRQIAAQFPPGQDEVQEAEHQFHAAMERYNEKPTDKTAAELSDANIRLTRLWALTSLGE